jgi:hypothetical protein
MYLFFSHNFPIIQIRAGGVGYWYDFCRERERERERENICARNKSLSQTTHILSFTYRLFSSKPWVWDEEGDVFASVFCKRFFYPFQCIRQNLCWLHHIVTYIEFRILGWAKFRFNLEEQSKSAIRKVTILEK